MGERKILVVDDEPQIREIFSKMLTSHKFAVQTAGSAEEALEIMQKSPCWVLFLDLKLPKMNGLELCRRIKKEWVMAIAYAVTGYASLFEIHGCREAGFDDYFSKPVNMSDLIEAAEQAFNKLERWKFGPRGHVMAD